MDRPKPRKIFEVLCSRGCPSQPSINVSIPTDIRGHNYQGPNLLKYTSFYLPAREVVSGRPLTILGFNGISMPDRVELFEVPYSRFDFYVKDRRQRVFDFLGIDPKQPTSEPERLKLIAHVESQFPKAVTELPPQFRISDNDHGRIPAIQNCRSRTAPFQCRNGSNEAACEAFYRRVNSDIEWDHLEDQFDRHRDGLSLSLDYPSPPPSAPVRRRRTP